MVGILLVLALGWAALNAIPRTEDPDLSVPEFGITAIMPGATPRDVEQQVVKPIENAIYTLDAVDSVQTFSLNGSAYLHVKFNWGTNPLRADDDLEREMNALRPSLPPGVVSLEVKRFRPGNVSLQQVALLSDTLPMRRFEKLAEKLREKIGTIPGVHEAQIWGVTPTEARVSLDSTKMAALNVSPAQVVDALRAAGSEGPIGDVNTGARRFNIEYQGAYPDLATIRATPIVEAGGAILHVGDIAQVDWAESEPRYTTRYDGQRAILISANANDGVDVTKLSPAITATLDSFERSLPAGVRLMRGFDQAVHVNERIGHLAQDFLIALALVSLTLLPIGLRAAAVVMIAIPLSLLFGLLVLYYTGYSLNQISIAGFIISLGILVDDAIVVVENISRWLRDGHDNEAAAIGATGQISLAVAGCTACLIFAFLPLAALPEASGEFVRSMPMAVFATVTGSFIVAMTVVPLVARYVLKPDTDHQGNRILRAVNRAIHALYTPVLHRALARPRFALAGLLLLTTLSLPLIGVIGTSLFPAAAKPEFIIHVQAQEGASF
ncbi:MAG: efflux RND transporter permease subunit, partial [Alphaproteobacteria bacterium]|nr:efflux RND transporter permease subunit [Alphaproteobacteria bacterium]